MHSYSTVSPITQRLVQVLAIVEKIAGVNGQIMSRYWLSAQMFHYLILSRFSDVQGCEQRIIEKSSLKCLDGTCIEFINLNKHFLDFFKGPIYVMTTLYSTAQCCCFFLSKFHPEWLWIPISRFQSSSVYFH